jgi:hypothetical protein
MRWFAPLAVLACIAFAAACSSSHSSSAAPSGDAGFDAGDLTVANFQMAVTVPAGDELFKCQLVTLPAVTGWMVKGEHDYTPGSHHLLLYTTDLTSIPAGGDQVQDCYGTADASTNIMSYTRGVLYAGQTPSGGETMPPGIGLPTTSSQILLFQVHYLNATANSLNAQVNVNLYIDTKNDITTNAGIFFFYDPFIDVPSGATAKASMRCLIPDDATLIYASSHYHARGVNYGAYIDPSVTQLGTTAFYTSDSWTSPPNQMMSMAIPGGSRIRFECDYDNSAGTQDYYAGQSALTNEMCMFIGTYYPAMLDTVNYCITSPDMFGNGTANCGATYSCLQSCGKLTLGSLGGGGVSDCEQTCMVNSCPTASGPLVPIIDCVEETCTTCKTDLSSSGCQSCLASNCGGQMSACQAHTCN